MKSARFKCRQSEAWKHMTDFFFLILAPYQNIFIGCFIFFLLLSSPLAQKKIMLSQIIKNPEQFGCQTIIVEGICIRHLDLSTNKFGNMFLFQDDNGTKAKVETIQELPYRDTEIAMACEIAVHPNGKFSHLKENRRICRKFPQQQRVSILSIVFFCLLGIASLVIATVLSFQILKNKRSAEKVDHFLARNRTRKIKRPSSIVPDTTYKSLPGKLVLQKNKKILQIIDLYQTTAQACFTIGRSMGPLTQHITIDDETVSMQQAKIEYINNKFIFTNLSRTNPSIVDGVQLAKNQTVELAHDSTIVMGEIVAKFEKATGGELWQLK